MHAWVCLECQNEWNPSDPTVESKGEEVLDANGNVLQDGDSVTVVKDLKVKGSSDIKSGTKVKNIRLTDGHDGHNISCKIDGVGSMYLKSEFVRKA
jgi:protein PhnA